MSKKAFFTIALFSLFIRHTFSQDIAERHTYGVIVGISEYADKAIKSLKYADDDAVMFANFLKTRIVKPSDTGNIKVFTNRKAMAIPVFEEIEKVTKKSKEGDTVYLYFSGHGDANNPDEIFLICNDAAKGAYAVGGGCINVKFLKNRIKIMQNKKVKVILITDACRSNEVMEQEYNVIFTSALSENSGEIQLTSCSSNEKSFEDKRWGNGHGVFTWYLLKGWMGLADKNNNNRVTFEELTNYIVEHVGNDTYDKITDTKLQIPSFCCSGYNNTLMAMVDPEQKKKLIESEESGVDNLYAALIPRYFSRGSDNERIVDSITLEYFDMFNRMLEREQYIEPDTNCAMYYYQRFEERQKTGITLEDSKLDLIAGMANKAQSYIQDFLRGNDSISIPEFYYASRLMHQALDLMDSTHQMYNSMSARALFLEANSLMSNQNEMSIAFTLLDSSLKLEPDKAYVYYSKARIYERFNIYFKLAEENYLKAIEMAPRWVFPMLDLGNMYINAGKYEKGSAYFNRAISIQPGPYMFTLLGHTYQYMSDKTGHTDSAIMYYEKALSLDSNYIDAILGLAVTYLDESSIDKSIECYKKAMSIDTTYYYTYLAYGNLFYDAHMNENAEYYYKKTIELNPQCLKAHWMLGNLYDLRLNDKDKAIQEYDECRNLDFYYTKAYVNMGNIYLELEQYNDAIVFLKYPITYDPNYDPVNLARAYFNREPKDSNTTDYDSAKLWLDTSNHYFPNDYYTHYLYGYYHKALKDYDSSILYCKESIRLKEDYYYPWLMLGDDYYLKGNLDSSVYFYRKSIEVSPKMEKSYKYLWEAYHYDYKDYKNALIIADSAIVNDINAPYFYYLKALSLIEEKAFDEALPAIESAISLSPGSGNYYYYKASILSSLNRIDESNKVLKEGIKIGFTADRENFYDGSFKNSEGNKTFEKIVKKYLKGK